MPNFLIRNTVKEIDRNIFHIIKEKKDKRFVIYTNGIGGRLVKEYLKSEFDITPEYIIDNKKYDGISILNIEQAKRRDNNDIYYLICSWHEDYYDEIRRMIYEVFPRERIIDVFPREDKILPTDEEIINVLEQISGWAEKLEEKRCL